MARGLGGWVFQQPASALDSQQTSPMISPYWTDLDSRESSAAVYLSQPTSDQVIVTWDQMGYYQKNYSGTATFQLVLNNPNALLPGQSSIGFYYGDVTSGTDNHNVTAGFGDGLSAINPGEISYFAGPSLAAAAALSGTSAFFQVNQAGVVIHSPVPEAGSLWLALAGLATLSVRRRRRV